jgi:hypothetical protein
MTVHDTRDSLGAPTIPRPRSPQPADDTPDRPDSTVEQTPAAEQDTAAVPARGGEFPWPEPWHFSLGARPRSEYWDTTTAGWHSRGPVLPPPRQG